jgi:hypothetical protein
VWRKIPRNVCLPGKLPCGAWTVNAPDSETIEKPQPL